MLDSPADFYGGPLAHLAVRLYKEFRDLSESSPLIIEGITFEILGEASKSATRFSDRRSPPWLRRVVELLHTQFSESLSLTSIAESVGVHPVHLARAFRRHHRCTVGEYVRHVRVEFARRELSESDAPLALIAAAAGFTDQSHLSKTFKRLTGQTPAEYRALSRTR